MGDFAKMNEVYSTYWGDVKPCRTYVFFSLSSLLFYHLSQFLFSCFLLLFGL